jgi:hypothetical protein
MRDDGQLELFDMPEVENQEEKDLLERNYYTAEFRKILEEVFQKARGPKTADYKETWKRVGLKGNYIKLMIKDGRLRNLIWEGKEPEVGNESLRDTLIDLTAYGVYSLICLDEGNIEGQEEVKEDHMALLDKVVKQFNEKYNLNLEVVNNE